MLALKAIGRFILFAMVIYVLLVIRWPGVRETYRDVYVWTANQLFAEYGDGGRVLAGPVTDDPVNDGEFLMGRVGVDYGQRFQFHTGQVGYVPMALLAALVLATPIPWVRKGWALLWGLLLVNLFVAFRMWMVLLFSFSRDVPYRLYEPGPFWSKTLSGFHEFVYVAPTCSFLVPVFIWVVVSLRREDFARISAHVRSLTGDTGGK